MMAKLATDVIKEILACAYVVHKTASCEKFICMKSV